MEAKLIKTIDGYQLNVIGHQLEKLGQAVYPHTITKQKLSLKNCQAIELGYDLDELSEIEAIKISETEVRDEKLERIYKRGFQKALEILGDKKFSEEDVMLGWDAGVMSKSIVFSMEQLEPHRESYQRNLKPASLQQTEWDVEIEMQCIDPNCDGVNRKGCCIPGDKPKLDSEGCLIIKKK